MLNGRNWRQYDDVPYSEPKELNLDYDRIQLIEENTDYKFTTGQKLNAELQELGDIATNELNDAVSKNWNILKYTPAILLTAGVLVILSHSNVGNLKKVFA